MQLVKKNLTLMSGSCVGIGWSDRECGAQYYSKPCHTDLLQRSHSMSYSLIPHWPKPGKWPASDSRA